MQRRQEIEEAAQMFDSKFHLVNKSRREEASSGITLHPPTESSEIFTTRGPFLSNSSRREAKNRCVRSAFGFCTIC